MRLRKDTAIILLICLSVSVLAFLVAFLYYRGVNRAEDPRVSRAKDLLHRSEAVIASKDMSDALRLLDSAEAAYTACPAYDGSFEYGIIHNNRCSALLMEALYDSSLVEGEKEKLLSLSLKYADSSISLYKDWISKWGSLGEGDLLEIISPDYLIIEGIKTERRRKKILDKRIRDIQLAQMETPRRLSVVLTNKGTVLRHMLLPDSALLCFEEALGLWKHNRTALSNREVLMGGKAVKPGIIESLFPPDRMKKD